MSYTISLTDPLTSAADLRMKGNDELNRLRESGAGDEVVEAAKAAIAAVADMLGTRYWGPGPYVVTISGNANEQHNPGDDRTNDSVEISIRDARTVDDLVNTSVTVVDAPLPVANPDQVVDQEGPLPGENLGDVEHPPRPTSDVENRPTVPVDAEPATRADGSPIGRAAADLDVDATPQDVNAAAAEAAAEGVPEVTVASDEPGAFVDAPADTPQGDAVLAPDGHDVTVEGAGEQTPAVTEQQAADAAAVGESQDAEGNTLPVQPELDDPPKKKR